MKKYFIFTLLLAVCGVFMLRVDVSTASEAFIFSDDFETYDSGNLGPPYTSTTCWQVVDDFSYLNTKSIKCYNGNARSIRTGNELSTGRQSLWFYIDETYQGGTHYPNLWFRAHKNSGGFYCNAISIIKIEGVWRLSDPNLVHIGQEISVGEWHLFSYVWSGDTNWGEVDGVAGDTYDCTGEPSFLDNFYMETNQGNAPLLVYIDNVGNLPAVSEIYITTPESGSTITDDSTELVGGWANIDSDTWTNIKLAFNDLQISETSGIVNIPITDDDGEFSISLSEFNIPNNGGWLLRSIVENDYEYNFDIPSVSYNLIFDVEGWDTPYAFTDFETWYEENVEDWDEPSTWAVSLTGFMNPIFEKIGQFGNRINAYLDVSDAKIKGEQIGSVFPVIGAYILKIDLFFGGFPIVQFFKWGILIMIGLFAVKIILKLLAFIPFIGGGG